MRVARKFTGALLITLGCFTLVLACLLFRPRFLEELEQGSWDWRARITAQPDFADRRIKLIVVDQASLDFLEREYSLTWPIPRDGYKHVISFLTAAGAKGLAFDLLFTESSALSVEGDRELARASGGPLAVVHALNLENYEKYMAAEKTERFVTMQRKAADAGRWQARFLGGVELREFRSATLPIMELIEGGGALGSVHAFPDSDGVFRRSHVGGSFRGAPVLSLPMSLFEATGGDGLPAGSAGERGDLIVKLHGPGSVYEAIPLASVLQAEADRVEGKPPRIPMDTFRDCYVFLGATAPGLFDLRPTSLEERGHGVAFLASVFDNLVHGDFIRPVPLPVSLAASLVVLLLTVLVALGGEDVRKQVPAMLAVAGAYIGGSVYAASQEWWLPLAAPLLGIVAAAFLGIGVQYQLEGRRHRFIRRAFQFYVSPAVVEQIVENPTSLAVGGEKRELSILFSDLEGFTSISERLDPTVLVAALNEYLSLMSEIVQSHDGTVDKYVGDAVVAFWNAPISVPEHALLAVRTAVHCQRELGSRADEFRERFGIELKARIGINTAVVSVGNFGSRTHFTYTMIGDGANLASRIEGINRYFGTRILLTGATAGKLGDLVPVRKVADIRVSGKEEIVTVYEPEIEDGHNTFVPENLARYHSAISLFESGELKEARELFAALDADPVSQAYVRRIDGHLRIGGRLQSPVWEFREK